MTYAWKVRLATGTGPIGEAKIIVASNTNEALEKAKGLAQWEARSGHTVTQVHVTRLGELKEGAAP